MKTLLRYLENIFLCMLIVLVVVSAVTFINSKVTKEPIPGIGKVKFLSVLSNSMRPTFKTYDLIIDIKTPMDKLKTGDVITFKKGEVFVTHRIVGIQSKNNETLYITRGDANNVNDEGLTAYKDVVGKYTFKLPYMGLIISYSKGLIGIVLVWALIIYVIIKEIMVAVKDKERKVTEYKELNLCESKTLDRIISRFSDD